MILSQERKWAAVARYLPKREVVADRGRELKREMSRVSALFAEAGAPIKNTHLTRLTTPEKRLPINVSCIGQWCIPINPDVGFFSCSGLHGDSTCLLSEHKFMHKLAQNNWSVCHERSIARANDAADTCRTANAPENSCHGSPWGNYNSRLWTQWI